MEDMNDSDSWSQGSRCYEKLKAMVDMNVFDRELKALDALNNSRLWMTWPNPGYELRALDIMKNSR